MTNKANLTPHQSQILGNRLKALGRATFLAALLLAGFFTYKESLRQAPLQYEVSAREFGRDIREKKKPCFVVFTLPHCYPCKVLEESIEGHAELKGYIKKNFLSYKIDGRDTYSGGKEIAEKYQIKEFPTVILTGADGELLGEIGLDELLKKDPSNLNELLLTHSMEKVSFKYGEEKAGDRAEKEIGLLYRTASNWSEALELINFLEKNWNQDIWLDPVSKEQIRIIIGRYSNPEKARITRKFLKLWEGEKTKLVKLEVDKIPYE